MQEMPFSEVDETGYGARYKPRIVHSPYFKKSEADLNLIKAKLSQWEQVRHYIIGESNSNTDWRHIVHMHGLDKVIAQGCRFPADWRKISASLVSRDTAGWTVFNSNCGYVLDVPSQDILLTSHVDICSYHEEYHVVGGAIESLKCQKPHVEQGGKCDVRCWVEFTNNQGRFSDSYVQNIIEALNEVDFQDQYDQKYVQSVVKDLRDCGASVSENATVDHLTDMLRGAYGQKLIQRLNDQIFKTPDELLRAQINASKRPGYPHNELILMGRSTPFTELYSGVPKPREVMVKGIYLLIDPKAPQDKRENEEAWAKKVSRLNCNVPILRVELQGLRMGCTPRYFKEKHGQFPSF